MPESNLPGNDKAENHPNKKTEAIAPPLAGVKGKSAQAPGQQKKPEPAQNGKGKGQQGNNSQAKTNGHAGTAGLNGIAHRSDRANEVAQNTHKNPHLVALGLGEGSDGATTGGDTGEATNPGQCDTLNAGCTAGEAEEAFYTGDEIVIIGSTKEQQFYYHPDHLGSTAYITDSSGQLTEHLEYFPFGETWVQEGGSKKTPYLYTGKELDQETGLYYYGARYYDPRVSVWASPDPILEKYLPVVGQKDDMLPGMGGVYNPKNLGLYAYTHQNPIVYSDPDGNIVFLIPALYAAYKAVSVASDVVDIATDIAEGDYTSASVTAAGMLDPTGITNKVRKASMAGKAVESVTDNVPKGVVPKAGSAGGEGAKKAFPNKIKDQARAESNDTCVFCGTKTTTEPGPTRSEIDHSIPKSRGGNNSLENAQNTCRTCNRQKGANTTEEFLNR